MESGGGDVIRQYLTGCRLEFAEDLECFFDFYSMIPQRKAGFAFCIARRCLLLAMEKSSFHEPEERLREIRRKGILPKGMIHLLELWANMDVDDHGVSLEHLFVEDERFQEMLTRELA